MIESFFTTIVNGWELFTVFEKTLHQKERRRWVFQPRKIIISGNKKLPDNIYLKVNVLHTI